MAIEENPKLRNDELLNYLLRPAKNIERKMLCDVLTKLSVFEDTKRYQYVGFGSSYFADFTLFHKVLGISKMTSIEGNEDMAERVRFNNPYSCIDIKIGSSTDMLPEIDWKNFKTIFWADYTEMLKGYMFKDMATFFTRALSGSVFMISINVELTEDGKKTITDKIKSRLDKDKDVKLRVPAALLKKEMKRDDYYKILQFIINEEIRSIIKERNKTTDEEFNFTQTFNFLYKDGQAMLTIGGVLYSGKDSEAFEKMNVKNFDFVRLSEGYFDIKVPNLTYREIQAIDKYLPNFNSDDNAKAKALQELNGVISEDSISKYAKLYRYYPKFVESYL